MDPEKGRRRTRTRSLFVNPSFKKIYILNREREWRVGADTRPKENRFEAKEKKSLTVGELVTRCLKAIDPSCRDNTKIDRIILISVATIFSHCMLFIQRMNNTRDQWVSITSLFGHKMAETTPSASRVCLFFCKLWLLGPSDISSVFGIVPCPLEKNPDCCYYFSFAFNYRCVRL